MITESANTVGILPKLLLPYQMRWVEDTSRFKIGMWSRQTGKSFLTACEAVIDCQARPGQLWVCLSAGERQAFEWLRKCRQWSDAVALACDGYEELSDVKDARKSKAEISFANGSRILAIPANPDTARGYSANLVLDEFAIHENSFEIWASIYPSISNPLSGEKRLRIVSTPKGMGNKFADLWHKNELYSRHKVTIEDAKADGLTVDVEELRLAADDADIFAQEYMCEFLDASGVLLSYELLQSCTMPETVLQDDGKSDLYIGMDIGRSHDLSAIVTLAEYCGTFYLTDLRILDKMPFAEQLEELCSLARSPRVRKCCIDATGIGAMLAEEARRKLGGKVEAVKFTAKTNGDMYAALRRSFEDKTIRIPPDRELREDLHAVMKKVSSEGTVSYSATRSADGHSDRASALALATRAATRHGVYIPPRSFGTKTDYRRRRIGR